MLRTIERAVLALAIAFFCAFSAAAERADPTVYGALPDTVIATISPDGSSIAALQNIADGAGQAVVFFNLDDRQAPPVAVGIGALDARTIQWANQDVVLLLISVSETVTLSSGLETFEFFRWVSISKSTGEAKMLFKNEPGYYMPNAGSFLTTRPEDPNIAIFARFTTRARAPTGPRSSRFARSTSFGYSLFEVNLTSGKTRIVASGTDATSDWLVNSDGDPVARVDYDPGKSKRTIFSSPDGRDGWKLVREFDEAPEDGSAIVLQGLSARANIALATVYDAQGKRALVEFDLRDGTFGDVVFNHQKYDLDALSYDAQSAKVFGVGYTDDLPRTHYLDSDIQTLANDLQEALPDSAIRIASISSDGAKMVLTAYYADRPLEFFYFDKNTRSLNMIAPSYNRLEGQVVAKKEPFDYAASDGLIIEGYLTVPSGIAKDNLPLIVLPHGGPETRDNMTFGWWEFFYAANGYLVFQPNFRGSDGYGLDFRSAGYGEWGRKMQSDITEGVEKLIADGVADPARICIVGASYGGYAALAGATLTPDLFACAVSVNGITDLVNMLGNESRSSELSEDYWTLRIGSRFRDEKALDAVSPLKQADMAKAPILLIHGKDDIIVPVAQSRIMERALKAARKEHTYVELDSEDHWLSTGEARIEVLRRSIEFIDRHIGE